MVIQILQCRHWASALRQATVSVPYPATLVSGRCSATMRSGALSAGSLDRSGYGSRSPGTPAARSPRHWEIAGDPDSREPRRRAYENRGLLPLCRALVQHRALPLVRNVSKIRVSSDATRIRRTA
ncbi:hypothetical protein ACR2R6_08305 [Methylocaldum gracile subsp. desertum]|uniref:hypothetical protein n=1 Tax=Methylocaldum sp. GT1BW TaxID=3438964 RepID=UPI003DA00EB0